MINNIDKLTIEDKALMIENKESFAFSTQISINYATPEWLDEISSNLSTERYSEIRNEAAKIYDTVISGIKATPDYVSPIFKTKMEEFAGQLRTKQSETKDQIADLIISFYRAIQPFILDINYGRNKPFACNQITAFFSLILPHKLIAHDIMTKTKIDNRPVNDSTFIFSYQCLRHLFEEYNRGGSMGYTAVVIYLICKYLNMEKCKEFYSALIVMSHVKFSIDPDELTSTVESLINEDTTVMQVLNNVRDEHIRQLFRLSNEILINANRQNNENYEKNKICDNLDNKGVCIGDNILDDGMVLKELVIELEKLSCEIIEDYIPELSEKISFTIDERMVGYLKVREKVPVCKIMMQEKGFYTIIRHNGIMYLLFTVGNDGTKIHGISFPAGFEGTRKSLQITLPVNLDYKLDDK